MIGWNHLTTRYWSGLSRGRLVGDGLGGRYRVLNDAGVRAEKPETVADSKIAVDEGEVMIAHRN